LSFALGLPLDVLRDMSADDLALYQQYTSKRGFPGRKVELLLAQVSQIMAQTMGGAKNTKLSDFLFDPAPELEEPKEMTVEEIRALHGFKPRKKKNG
jgi:hypothetical protein